MEKFHCPRCDQPIPSWQPVHLPCFIARAQYWILGLFLALLATITIVVTSNFSGG